MKITDIKTFPLSIPFRPMRPHSPWADGVRKQIMIQYGGEGTRPFILA